MAVMVRWVQNMGVVVQRGSTCESACFGLFAAASRKYVDTAFDPSQIGVHSVYEVIKEEGAQAALFKESGNTTIKMVRLFVQLGICHYQDSEYAA